MSRRPPKRPFVRRYAPLLLTALAILVVVGIRTDDPVGFNLAEQFEQGSADDEAGAATTTTEADEVPLGTLPSSTTNPNLDDPDDVPDSLRSAQLTLGDLPDGWQAASLEDGSTEVCPGHDPAAAVAPEHALKAGFTASDDGPAVTSIILEFDGDDEADEYLDALEDVISDCDGLEDARGLRFELERTQDVDLGDRSVTADQEISTGDASASGRIFAVRVGERVALIAFAASGDADASVAVEALETVVGRLAD